MMAQAVSAMSGADSIKLVGEGGPYDGRVFDVPAQPCTVGRALDNELVFDDPSLSRKHSRLQREGPGRLVVEDLGSSNGTYVNGRKMGRGSAGPGDTIQFGDLVFRVEAQDLSGTRAVEAGSGRGQWIALSAFGAVTFVVLVGMIIALARKPPIVQAPGKEAIARYTAKADLHLRQGRSLYHERKYTEAKQELDAALDVDPANQEARRLSRLASRGPDDDRLLGATGPSLRIADRKALETVTRHLRRDDRRLGAETILAGQAGAAAGVVRPRSLRQASVGRLRLGDLQGLRSDPQRGRAARRQRSEGARRRREEAVARSLVRALPIQAVIYWEKLRTELGRYADGVHEVGAPRVELAAAERRLGRKLPPALVELYRSFDGLRLFTDSFVILGADELAREGELVRLGEALGAPLLLDEAGHVYEVDEAGDRVLCGSDVARFIDAVLAREKLVVDREGEYKAVFADGGELDDETRKKRVRAALKADPESAAWRLESAELAFEAGREEEARGELSHAVAADAGAGAAWALLLGGLDQRAGRLSTRRSAPMPARGGGFARSRAARGAVCGGCFARLVMGACARGMRKVRARPTVARFCAGWKRRAAAWTRATPTARCTWRRWPTRWSRAAPPPNWSSARGSRAS